MNQSKKVQLFNSIELFENFVNRTDIEIMSIDIKCVEQSMFFQENFAGIVYYKESTPTQKLYTVEQLREAIAEAWNTCEDNEDGETFSQCYNRIMSGYESK